MNGLMLQPYDHSHFDKNILVVHKGRIEVARVQLNQWHFFSRQQRHAWLI